MSIFFELRLVITNHRKEDTLIHLQSHVALFFEL